MLFQISLIDVQALSLFLCKVEPRLDFEKDQMLSTENGNTVDRAPAYQHELVIVLIKHNGRQAGDLIGDWQRRKINIRPLGLEIWSPRKQLDHHGEIALLRLSKAVKMRFLCAFPTATIPPGLDVFPEKCGKCPKAIFYEQNHINVLSCPETQRRVVHQNIAGRAADNSVAVLVALKVFPKAFHS